jgi:DNA-binding response OmpR family regulator
MKKLIVYVEDEPDMIEMYRPALGEKGFQVLGALNAEKGLEVIRQKKPDLVLLDLMLKSEIDGWEVYRQMKADRSLSNIPVIIVTSRIQSTDEAEKLQMAKTDGYLNKPVTPKELIKAVERVLEGREWE